MDEKAPVTSTSAPEAATPQRSPVEQLQLSFANGFLALLDMKSPKLAAHCRRVSRWCREMGRMLAADEKEMFEYELAGLLHDVGFIVTTSTKPGDSSAGLMPAESPALRHPVAGHAALSRIVGFERIAKAVLAHHEQFDGRGYPQGLAGDKIPLLARVISVVDAYDNECHARSPMQTADEDKVRKTLARVRGQLLDPDIVNKFLFVLTTSDPVRRYNEREIEITPTALRPGMVLSRDLRSIENVLLMKADTVLTQELLGRFLSSDNINWLVTMAYVDIASIRDELPIDTRSEESPVPGTAEAGVTVQEKPEVLVVDDAMAVPNALRRELGRVGINITGVTTTEEAMDLLQQRRFDAVISDLMIGSKLSFPFIREVNTQWPWLHVVVLSGFPTADNIRALREFNNIVRFVTKPWSSQVLLAAVREALHLTTDARQKTEAQTA